MRLCRQTDRHEVVKCAADAASLRVADSGCQVVGMRTWVIPSQLSYEINEQRKPVV